MIPDRLEAMRHLIVAATTRRALVGLLTASGLSHGAPAKAKAKPKKKACSPCRRRTRRGCKAARPDGTACATGTCRGGVCVAPPAVVSPAPCGAGGPCRVFLTSTLHTGALGGLTGADSICTVLAGAAGLPGTYKAWLSDSTSSPDARFVPSTGPYQLVNGTTIAANWNDLTDGVLLAGIDVTETGGGVGGVQGVWTYTLNDGTPALGSAPCQNWQSPSAASPGATGGLADFPGGWTDYFSGSCSSAYHLYCFQQR